MVHTFPEEDFCLQPHYIRRLSGDGTHCIAMVSKKWEQRIITENCLSPPDRHPVLTDVEVQLFLDRSDGVSAADPWMRLELYRIPLKPSALLNRRCFTNTGPEVEHAVFSEEDKMDLLLNGMRTTEVLRSHGSSVQAMLACSPVDTVTALDTVRHLCESILGCPFLDFSSIPMTPCNTVIPPNTLSPLFVACMVDHFVAAFPFRPLTLTSCLRFSPALISTDAAASFILFQILFAIAYFQQNAFYVGDLGTSDILIKENLWVEMKPISVFRALCRLEVEPPVDAVSKKSAKYDSGTDEIDGFCKLSEWTSLWCLGKISNYDYLHAVNYAAGRDFTPDYYPIFPWVTDFSSPDGWRDLTRSKYHLTKGDRQLDLTFNTLESGMVPHHIPETFSDLTFYIYNARRIPKSVLCQYVRKKFVPAEYPASMERLYKWTPDECIPEFYSDPTIFKSIHNDLPDLALPSWCKTVEDFLNFHRHALEHPRVTNSLHHWIDLNFGYKLTGEAAVAAKNVILSLTVPQTRLKNHGINQIFKLPHPPRFQSVPWYLKPAIPPLSARKKRGQKVVAEDTVSISSEDFCDDAILEMESVSENAPLRPISAGYTSELEELEKLLGLCFSLDHGQPKILEDFVESAALLDHGGRDGESTFLRKDLQAFACVALEVLLNGTEASVKIENESLDGRVQRFRISTSQKMFGCSSLVDSVTALLVSNVFPYSAVQILYGEDKVANFPDWMYPFHSFVCELRAKSVNVEALEVALEMMTQSAFPLLSPFLHDLFALDDRAQYVTLLLDTVVKYYGPVRATETFRAVLCRIHADLSRSSVEESQDHNELFDKHFLNTMMIRFGVKNFLRLFIVPLIEKLADIQPLLLPTPEAEVLELLAEQPVFPLEDADMEDDVADRTSLFSVAENNSAQTKIISALLWLAEDLGPVLCARYITGNLLKSLSLCYVDPERLKVVTVGDIEKNAGSSKVTGDVAALGVTEALLQVTFLYGRSFVWNQYFPYAAELAKDALRNLTPLNAAGLLGCIQMMALLLEDSGTVPEEVLLEHLPFQIVNEVLFPVVKIVTSTTHLFPLGAISRRILTTRWTDLIYTLSNRIGRDEARKNFTDPLLVTFFSIFSRLYEDKPGATEDDEFVSVIGSSERREDMSPVPTQHSFGSPFVSIDMDSLSGELKVGSPVAASLDSITISPEPSRVIAPYEQDQTDVIAELKEVFTESLAFDTYVSFCRLLGQFHMNEKLMNGDLLHEICSNRAPNTQKVSQSVPVPARPTAAFRSSSQNADSTKENYRSNSASNSPVALPTSPRIDDSRVDREEMLRSTAIDRTLEGNWLAHWQYELGQGRSGATWNIKQIPLQTFTSHSGQVKSILVLDSENSFISGSKDKTVRLWNIRNSGSGDRVSQAEGLYVEHKRSVSDLRFLARERLVASSDGVIHIWDPWTVTTVGRIDLLAPAVCIDCSAAPSSVLFVGHGSEQTSYISRFDVRLKTSATNSGRFIVTVPSNTESVVRTLVVSPDDTWFACGFSSGIISVFDQRTGMLFATWKPYDHDVQELQAISGSVLASVGPDNVISLWDIKRDVDDRLLRKVDGFPESVLKTVCTKETEEADALVLMSGSRMAVAADILRGGGEVITTKVRHETLKGHFSTMSILPMNRQVLLGSETGHILLMC